MTVLLFTKALYMNCLKHFIKFTHHVGTTNVNFLDSCILIVDKQMVSSLYRKDTEKNSLLDVKSGHPTSLKHGDIPISDMILHLKFVLYMDRGKAT